MCVCVRPHTVMSDSFVTSWTVAHQASLSMGFSRQACWSVLPFPPPGDLPNPGIEPESPAASLHWQVDSLPLHHLGSSNYSSTYIIKWATVGIELLWEEGRNYVQQGTGTDCLTNEGKTKPESHTGYAGLCSLQRGSCGWRWMGLLLHETPVWPCN